MSLLDTFDFFLFLGIRDDTKVQLSANIGIIYFSAIQRRKNNSIIYTHTFLKMKSSFLKLPGDSIDIS